MKVAVLALAAIAGVTLSLSGASAKVHEAAHRTAKARPGAPPKGLSTASLRVDQAEPRRTAPSTGTGQGIDGQGILAPNGYRGDGSLTGGPAGGLDSGGP